MSSSSLSTVDSGIRYRPLSSSRTRFENADLACCVLPKLLGDLESIDGGIFLLTVGVDVFLTSSPSKGGVGGLADRADSGISFGGVGGLREMDCLGVGTGGSLGISFGGVVGRRRSTGVYQLSPDRSGFAVADNLFAGTG